MPAVLWSRLTLSVALVAIVLAADVAAEVRPLDPPVAEGSRSYSLVAGGDGAVFLSWVERQEEGGHVLRFAELKGEEWGPAGDIASGADWFVNWIDHPAVAPLGGDRLAAHWLVHDEDRRGDYGYGIRLVFSDDRGASWRSVFEARGEGRDGYAGFVAYAGVAGGFEVAYLASVDDEPVVGGGADASTPDGDGAAGHSELEPRMTLRSTRFDTAGKLLGDREVDADVCSCCTTAMVADPVGVFVAFRDRRAGEFRDISYALLEGERWTDPRLVHRDGWHIRGCPTNGPAIASGGQGPAVAWFTAAGGESRVLAAYWNREKKRFGDPIRIDSGSPRGWAGVAMLEDGNAAVSWVERRESGSSDLRVRRVSPDGSKGRGLTVAPAPPGRSAIGVPKLVRSGDRLVFAWRDGSVRTAALRLADLE